MKLIDLKKAIDVALSFNPDAEMDIVGHNLMVELADDWVWEKEMCAVGFELATDLGGGNYYYEGVWD